MYKVCQFPGVDPHSGSSTVQRIEPGDSEALEKTAQALHPTVRKYVARLKPHPDKVYVLIIALGASEYYGQNINGDIFPEAALTHRGTDYGYQTFLNGHVFKHHQNKNPELSFGTIPLSVWNEDMKRVELILELSRERAARFDATDILDKIEAGIPCAVSMGCFLAGAQVTMADGTRKAIENIQVGDLVLTHKGRPKKVTEIHKRSYTGSIYAIKPEAHETIYATKEHPFLVAPVEDVRKDRGRRWADDLTFTPEWRHAEHLEEGYLLETVFDDVLTPDYVSPAFARFFGYYLAEGHVLRGRSKEIVGVEFSTHKDDAIHDEIEQLCQDLDARNAPWTYRRPNSDVARSIQVHDPRLAQLCYEHGGSYSKKKKLSEAALRWHPDLHKEMLGAYANGDGCFSNGALKLSTASTSLAQQWLIILARLGIQASVQNLEHKAGTGFSAHATWEWVIHIGKQWAEFLSPVCAKVKAEKVLATKRSRMEAAGTDGVRYVLTPIRDIESSEQTVDVYNFEVEDDKSYLVSGLAVHNCKVPYDICTKCHNRAKIREDYCYHLKYEMNKVYGDGSQAGAINTIPRFFDLSFIFIGADKIAYTICKIASGGCCPLCEKLAARGLGKQASAEKKAVTLKRSTSQKLGDIFKETPATFIRSTVPLLEDSEPDIPRRVLDEMGSRYPLQDSLATPSSMGMVLKPREYQRIILIRLGMGRMADDLDSCGEVFRQTQDVDDSLSFGRFQPELAQSLMPHMQERSAFGPILKKRLLRILIVRPKIATIEKTSKKDFLDKIARGYNGYRLRVLSDMPLGLDAVLDTNPGLMAELFQEGFLEAFSKSAAVETNLLPMKPLLGIFSVLYFLSAHWQAQELHGRKLGFVKKFVAEHPELSTLLLAGAWGGAARKGMARVTAALQ